MARKLLRIIPWLLFAVAVYFPLFLHLDSPGLHRWDESRNAVTACEMMDSGRYLVRTFLGHPDHWETKPPLLIWLQVLAFRVLGYTELAVRLPSALAALATLGLVLWFFIKKLDDTWGGVFTCLALLGSEGYIRQHVTRTGDHDALLILFLVAFLLFFFLHLQEVEGHRRRWLYPAVLALIGGVLTKSIAGLFFLPGAFVFMLLSGKTGRVLTNPHFYLGAGLFILLIGGYYGLREQQDPGYLRAVWQMELFPRYFNTADMAEYQVPGSRWYYVRLIMRDHFRFFWWFVPLGLLLLLRAPEQRRRSFSGLVALTAGLFLLVISRGTVNSWYDAPAMPLLAIITGAGVSELRRLVLRRLPDPAPWKAGLLSAALTGGLFAPAYARVIEQQAYSPAYSTPDMKYGDFLKKLYRDRPDIRRYFIYFECLNAHVTYYANLYHYHRGIEVYHCGPCESIRGCHQHPGPGEYVMICRPAFIEEFLTMFEATEEEAFYECRLFRITGVKE